MNFNDNSLYNCLVNRDGERYSLFDLAIWKNGLAFKNINFSDCGVPVIKIAELNNGIGGTTAYTNQSFQEDVHLHKGDLLFSWSGNPDTSIDIFRSQLNEGWLNQHIFKVTPNEKLIDKDYFYFLMKFLKPIFTKIAKNKQTTGLGHVTIGDIKQLNVVIPDMMNQRQIVSVLKPIDDKITLNNAINCNLAEQICALYTRLRKEKIWSICPIGQMAEKVAMGPFGSNIKVETFVDTGVPIISGNHLRSFLLEDSTYNFITEEHAAKLQNSIVFAKDIIFTHAGNIGQVAMIPDNCEYSKYVLSQRQFYLRCNTSLVLPEWVLMFFHSREGQHELLSFANQTGVPSIAQPASNLKKIEIPLPPIDTQREWLEIVSPMFSVIQQNKRTIQKLSSLRDTLLPKLMSGEIDVSKVEL